MVPSHVHGCPERGSNSPPPARDSGFTLVELIVACVLLVIAVAMVGGPLLNALRGSAGTSTTAAAERMVEDAENRFASDVMAAYSPDRERSRLRGDSKFAQALTDGNFRPTSDDPTENGRELAVYDVMTATPSVLQLRADVLAPEPGTECVTYTAARSGGTFSLQRVVRRGSIQNGPHSCGTTLRTEDLITSAPVVAGITDAPVFSYGVLTNTCRVRMQGTVRGTELNRIASVELRVGSIVQRGGSASAAQGSSLVAIRSRDAGDYRRSLGC